MLNKVVGGHYRYFKYRVVAMILHLTLRPVYRQFSQIVAPVVDVSSLYSNTFCFKHFWLNYDAKGVSKIRLYCKTTWQLKRIFCCFKILYPIECITPTTSPRSRTLSSGSSPSGALRIAPITYHL